MDEPTQPPPEAPPVIPVRLERYDDAPATDRRTWLHPISALVILAIDWLFFAEEAVTFGVAIPVACVLAFSSTLVGVYWIQRRKGGDTRRHAIMKALFGAIIAGVPTSVGGTILGTVVLMLAGMRSRNRKSRN